MDYHKLLNVKTDLYNTYNPNYYPNLIYTLNMPSKTHCSYCNNDYAKSYYKKHLLSKKHLKNQEVHPEIEPVEEPEQEKDFTLYLLKNTRNKNTYLGVTKNSEKRIKQHNGKLKGGAKYTRAKKGKGKWIYHMKVTNLTKSEAYSMESLIKWAAKKNYKKGIRGDKSKSLLERKVDLLLSFKEKFSNCEVNYF